MDRNYIGYLDHPNQRVYVEIHLSNNHRGRLRLSITGEAGDGSCGQIDMHIKASDITPGKSRTREQIERLWDIWANWHLNDMRAGCEHQNAHVRANNRKSGWAIGEHCPVCDYRYGHEWIYERVPDNVIEFLLSNFAVNLNRR